MMFSKLKMITPEDALPGRDDPLSLSGQHTVLGTSLLPPYPTQTEQIVFGMGCFWGAERKFWQLAARYNGAIQTTAVGYAAGYTPNPTYREVCTGKTGHNEVVLVVYDPEKIPFSTLLQTFWENHDPTQGMRQGNDQGTQYRSGIYYANETQKAAALESRDEFQQKLAQAGFGPITTEIKPLGDFYYAEEYHQQYLHKNPNGYCGLGGTGVCL